MKHLSVSTKENGLIMLSTIKRSVSTWFSHILLAEKISGIVPEGTHHYDKFINPEECKQLFEMNGI